MSKNSYNQKRVEEGGGGGALTYLSVQVANVFPGFLLWYSLTSILGLFNRKIFLNAPKIHLLRERAPKNNFWVSFSFLVKVFGRAHTCQNNYVTII